MEHREYPPVEWTDSPESGAIPVLGDLAERDAESNAADLPEGEVYQRRILLPVVLFIATCGTTFWAGALMSTRGGGIPGMATTWWQDALIYMAAVMGILLAHEMGHFIQAVRYGVPASLPFFIPMPALFRPATGTLGAVIGLQGSQANRKELFDIGLSGPLAGLVVAIPVTWIGIKLGAPFVPEPGRLYESFSDPLIVQWMIAYLRPEVASGTLALNPLLLAGWVGMLVTGLNMLPVSQLDGGHVIYSLFGKYSYIIARLFIFAAIAFIVFSNQLAWIAMLLLVMMIGIEHPPTSDDTVPLGRFRRLLGLASLSIPVLCFTPIPMELIPG